MMNKFINKAHFSQSQVLTEHVNDSNAHLSYEIITNHYSISKF